MNHLVHFSLSLGEINCTPTLDVGKYPTEVQLFIDYLWELYVWRSRAGNKIYRPSLLTYAL